MLLTKKMLYLLIVVCLIQPIILFGILKANENSTFNTLQAMWKINHADQMYQSARMIQEGSAVILKEYKVTSHDELKQLADRTMQEANVLTKDFNEQSVLSMRVITALIAFEFFLSVVASIWLTVVYIKSRKKKSTNAEFPNQLA